MYSSDGLPQWYYNTLSDRFKLREMRQAVFEAMTGSDGEATPIEVCEIADINTIFIDEVEMYMDEWGIKYVTSKNQ